MDRKKLLNDLILLNKPIETLTIELSKLDWDYEGQSLILNVMHVQNILQHFIDGKYSAQELEDWANLIECREDLEFEDSKHEQIKHVIYCLANPLLQGKITNLKCKSWINFL